MILILDVSSTAIGYCLFEDDGRRMDAGVIRPAKKSETDSCRRAYSMGRDVQELLDEHAGAITSVVIEEAPKFKAKGDIAAQNRAYGLVMGVLLGSKVPVHSVFPAAWTRNTNKERRNLDVRRRLGISATVDPGGDACDAIGLGEWWFAVGKHRVAQPA